MRKYEPALNAQAEVHFEGSASVAPGKFEPTGATGSVELSSVTWNKVPYGNITVRSETHGSPEGDHRRRFTQEPAAWDRQSRNDAG